MKTTCIGGAAGAMRSLAKPSEVKTVIPVPTDAQVKWQNYEIGLLYCFDLAIAAGIYTPNNTYRKRIDPNKYNPQNLDTDQWADVARSCDANYAVFTASHFNGFMQWQSDAYPYSLKQTSWRGGKGDVTADFCTSFRNAGVAPGVFFSVHRNVYQELWGHYVKWGEGRGTPEQEAYNRIAEKQMTEICSKYGSLSQIWFDAGTNTPEEGGPDMLPIFEKYQPDSIFYSSSQRSDYRWVGNESGHAGVPCYATMPGPEQGPISHRNASWKRCLYKGDPNGTVWSPAMVDIPLRGFGGHNWFYEPNQDRIVYSPEALMKRYYTSVGRNSNLVIGVVIKPDGSIPEADVKSLQTFGRMLRDRFGKPLAELKDTQGRTIVLKLKEPQAVDHVVLQEQIKHGERVRDHVVEGLVGSDWTPLAEGKVIGHKWIYRFNPQIVSALRLRVTESLATPDIRSFACFSVGDS